MKKGQVTSFIHKSEFRDISGNMKRNKMRVDYQTKIRSGSGIYPVQILVGYKYKIQIFWEDGDTGITNFHDLGLYGEYDPEYFSIEEDTKQLILKSKDAVISITL